MSKHYDQRRPKPLGGLCVIECRGAPRHGEREARTYKGVWGLGPQRGPGAKPLVRGSGGLRPPEADAF